jgi:hypothetical protein
MNPNSLIHEFVSFLRSSIKLRSGIARSTPSVVRPRLKLLVTIFILYGMSGWLANAQPFDTNTLSALLKGVPALELPAVAAVLVKESKPRDRTSVATSVVRSALRINPAATPAVVGAVVRVAPQMAAAVSTVAVHEHPDYAPAVTQAAVAIAPTYAREVVISVCTARPADYHAVAVAAAGAAPSRSEDILRAVCVLRPELKCFIEADLARLARHEVPSVARCLDRAELARDHAAKAAIPPGLGLGGDPSRGEPPLALTPPGHGGPKPPRGGGSAPGGRNYARP